MLSAWQNPGMCTYLQVDHRENGGCNHPPFSKAYLGTRIIHSHKRRHCFFFFFFNGSRLEDPSMCCNARPPARPAFRARRAAVPCTRRRL